MYVCICVQTATIRQKYAPVPHKPYLPVWRSGGYVVIAGCQNGFDCASDGIGYPHPYRYHYCVRMCYVCVCNGRWRWRVGGGGGGGDGPYAAATRCSPSLLYSTQYNTRTTNYYYLFDDDNINIYIYICKLKNADNCIHIHI